MDALLFEIVLWTKDSKTSISFYWLDVAIERQVDQEIVYYWELSLCAVWTWFQMHLNPWRPNPQEMMKEAEETEELPF
jgi:hypothetical protein